MYDQRSHIICGPAAVINKELAMLACTEYACHCQCNQGSGSGAGVEGGHVVVFKPSLL